MSSVRIAAAGAVVFCVSFLTVPASACDFDRYQKKCDRELAARADADASTERKSVKRVRASSRRAARHARLAKRVRSAPRFVLQRENGIKLASAEARAVLLPESVLARRFRGFIDPKPLSQNSFEVLRKPHLVALDLDPAVIVPAVTTAAPAPAETAPAPAAPEPPAATPAVAATVATTPKQDKIAPKAATMELASAESKPVALASLASRPAAAPPVAPVQASVTEAPNPASRFSFHQLVLALCGALGAASALRFIVGA